MAVDETTHAHFDQNLALKSSEPYTSITIQTREVNVSLPPRYIGREHEFLLQVLAMQMGKCMQGKSVPVGYKKIQRIGMEADICEEKPDLFMSYRIEYVLFEPSIGDQLVAQVNKTSTSHIGMLIHDSFNASIAIDDDLIAVGQPNIGDTILIEVTKLNSVKRILSIDGKLVKILNQAEANKDKVIPEKQQNTEENNDYTIPAKKSKQKKKERKKGVDKTATDIPQNGDLEDNNTSVKEDQDITDGELVNSCGDQTNDKHKDSILDESSPPKKKRKKAKKNHSNNECEEEMCNDWNDNLADSKKVKKKKSKHG